MGLAAVAVTILAFGLYYAIGRPFEIELLRNQTQSGLSGTFSDPSNELLLPQFVGAIPAAILSVVFGLIGRGGPHVSGADVSRSDILVTGIATYLVIGVLLWLHAAAAWVVIGLSTGSYPSPATDPWIRFADEAGPQYAIWYPIAWPWMIIACCG